MPSALDGVIKAEVEASDSDLMESKPTPGASGVSGCGEIVCIGDNCGHI